MSLRSTRGPSKHCRARGAFWLALAALFHAAPCRAGSLFGVINFSPATAAHFANSLGLAFDHRSFEAATGLAANGAGLDIGLDVSLTRISGEFNQAINEISPGTSLPLPALPAARASLHKSINRRVDVGASWISTPPGIGLPFSLSLLGFDLKYVVWEPEESPTWAVRLSYGQSTFGLPLGSQSVTVAGFGTVAGTATMTTMTYSWTPQVLVSRKLEWAEGYLGIGYRIPTTTVKLDLTFTAPLDQFNQTASETGTGGAFEAFTGVSMRVPGLGVRLTLEGWYSSVGAPGLGLKLGTSF